MTLLHSRLLELLDYNPEEGGFYWRTTKGSKAVKGSKAGTRSPSGYFQIGVDGKVYLRARMVWFYVHGRWPEHQIDHKNLIIHDDRLSNLREATQSQNNANKGNERSLPKGVSFDPRSGFYYAKIKKNGKSKFLGCFKCPTRAHEAYCNEATKQFGEFARFA